SASSAPPSSARRRSPSIHPSTVRKRDRSSASEGGVISIAGSRAIGSLMASFYGVNVCRTVCEGAGKASASANDDSQTLSICLRSPRPPRREARSGAEPMTPPPLPLHLFGPLRVLVRGEPLPRVRSQQVEWLLALLALRHGRSVKRSWLAGT